jgi:hypothetical protein
MTEQNEQSTPPNSHRAPEILSTQAENELICEKLLGWERWREPGKQLQWKNVIDGGRGWTIEETPSFTTWAEAGLILDALHARDVIFEMYRDGAGTSRWNVVIAMITCSRERSGPAAVRDCALQYIRRLP